MEETPKEESPKAEAAEAQTVPYERFAQKVAEVKALEAKLSTVGEMDAVVKAWEAKYAELQDKFSADKQGWEQKEALMRTGILDEDVADLARWRFSKSDSDNFVEWLQKEALEDTVLKPHLSKEVVKVDAPKPVAEPPVNNGVKNTPAPARGELSPEAVQQMSLEDIRKNYAKIAGAWGYTPHNFDKS